MSVNHDLWCVISETMGRPESSVDRASGMGGIERLFAEIWLGKRYLGVIRVESELEDI